LTEVHVKAGGVSQYHCGTGLNPTKKMIDPKKLEEMGQENNENEFKAK